MKGKGGIFDLTSDDIFNKITNEFNVLKEMLNNPEDEKKIKFLIINLIFYLNHLREWICPDNECLKNDKCEKLLDQSKLNNEQKIFIEIYRLKGFKIINKICNCSKHFKIIKTDETKGLRAGYSRCGDSLGRYNLFIKDEKSKKEYDLYHDIIFPVIIKYKEYFNKKS